MYQPPSQLYASIAVPFIDLSPLIPHVMRQVVKPDTLTALEQDIQTLEAQHVGKICTTPNQYAILYRIGRRFRAELQRITEEAGRKLEQGILAGLWDSLLAHEIQGLSSNLSHTLRRVRRGLATLPGEAARNLDAVLQGLTDTAGILEDRDHYFRAIKMATGNAEALRKAIQDKTPLYQEKVTCHRIADIVAFARRLGDVTGGEKGAFDSILDGHSISLEASQVQSNTTQIQCFPWLLALALFNLFKNVPKNQGLTATVTAYDSAGWVEVVVEDNGRGFPNPPANPNDLTKLGASGPPQGDKTPHQGLGLFVVDRIITAHGGRLVLENKPQGGAAHRITLPATTEGESV